jgi:hypothetical protein
MRYLLVVILTLSFLSSGAQIATMNEELYPAIKTKTLYIPVSDSTKPFARTMMETVRSNWTFCPVSFVSSGQVDKLYLPGNLFLTLDHSSTSFHFVRQDNKNRITTSEDIKNDYFYLNFWLIGDKYKAGSVPRDKDKVMLARAELYLKSIGTGSILFHSPDICSQIFELDFCNGLPGYMKNVFQAVNRNFSGNVTVNLKKDMEALPGLRNLQKDTLYVPNYWYGPGGTMLPDEPESSANGRYIRKMLDEYPFPVRLVRRDELSDMILRTKKPLYYFNYVQSSANKMISIVNGLTGEILFYNFNDKSYRPKGSDFKDLGKEVQNAN